MEPPLWIQPLPLGGFVVAHAMALPTAVVHCGTFPSARTDPFGYEILLKYGTAPTYAQRCADSRAAALLRLSAQKNAAPVAPKPLRMDMAVCYRKDHDEDAHLLDVRAGVLGVADGVGGYRAQGVDAAAFARALCANAQAELGTAVPGTPVWPHTLLERAYERTIAANTPGASTAVILSLAGDLLRWAYVGDSGFVLFRDGKVLRRSVPQQRYFNCPFQLCSASGCGNPVSDAAVGEVQVKQGDILVVASDGLFDNLFDEYLEQIVAMGTVLRHSPKEMADLLASSACDIASSYSETPFSFGSRKERGTDFRRGKPDDVTVLVAYIGEQ